MSSAEQRPRAPAPWVRAAAGAAPASGPGGSRSVGFAISTTGYAIARRFSELLVPLGLEPRDLALLRAIAAQEGATQQAVAEALRIAPSRMVALIDSLEQRGLVARHVHPTDRRARVLALTEAGRALLAQARARADAHERELSAELSAQERESLLEMLDRVAARVGLSPGAAPAHSALAEE